MKKILFTFVLMCMVFAGYAQHKLNLAGTVFNVSFDNNSMTAEIVDREYKVDDREYPMHNYRRKIRDFKKMPNRTLEIPEKIVIGGYEYTVTSIGHAAFAGYWNVDEIIIPNTVESIGDYAFLHSSLKRIVIPSSVLSIGNRAFGHCPKLKSLTLPNATIQLGDNLYTESKMCELTYTEISTKKPESNLAQRRTPKVKKPVEPIGPADVDIDIPTVSTSNNETFAIIIANENYQSEVAVKFAHNDGRIFYNYCQSVLGIPEENIHYREDATLNNILSEVNWVSNVASIYGGDARIIVYYAGHGMPDESTQTAYLLPVDGSGSDFSTGYSLDKLYKALGELPCKNVTVFLDACFSGSQRGDGMLANTRGVAIKARESDPQGKMVVFSAAQGDETAWPYTEKGHGLFTYYLLKKLKETKGNVTYGELGDYIQKEVSRRAIVVNSKPQTPTASPSSNLSDTWRKLKLR
ncbi:MAG: caspase family protein [Bacteroidaceae bacterium]|nr:caspase family protein [Bacteroidaceae bacterium]